MPNDKEKHPKTDKKKNIEIKGKTNDHIHNQEKDHFQNIDKDKVYNRVLENNPGKNFIELGDLKDELNQSIKYNLPNFWLFKVIGANTDDFHHEIQLYLAGKQLKDSFHIKDSKEGRYCSYNFEIYIQDKEVLYTTYKELKAIRDVKYCL